jgi:hypothetical protein
MRADVTWIKGWSPEGVCDSFAQSVAGSSDRVAPALASLSLRTARPPQQTSDRMLVPGLQKPSRERPIPKTPVVNADQEPRIFAAERSTTQVLCEFSGARVLEGVKSARSTAWRVLYAFQNTSQTGREPCARHFARRRPTGRPSTGDTIDEHFRHKHPRLYAGSNTSEERGFLLTSPLLQKLQKFLHTTRPSDHKIRVFRALVGAADPRHVGE